MRLSSIVAPLACLGAVVNAALTTVEFDLVFPRDNVSYAPTAHLPVIFAAKNSLLAQYMAFSFAVQTRAADGNFHTISHVVPGSWGDSASNETTFFWGQIDVAEFGFTRAGSWPLRFLANWESCSDGPRGSDISENGFNQSSPASILFRTAKGGQPVSLLDTTDTTCETRPGFRITVDEKTETVPNPSWPSAYANGTHQCVKVMPISPPGSDLVAAPCSAKVPADLVQFADLVLTESTDCTSNSPCPAASTLASIMATRLATTATVSHASTALSAATTAATTAGTTTTASTTTAASDPSKNAAERLAMAGTAWLAAAFGVFGFLLA